MAEKRTRRRFTAEFKAQAVRRLLEGGKGLGEVATELGLSPGQLSGWRNEHLAAGSAEALAQRKAEQAEAQRLKREVKRPEEEVEILKKAAAFFARGSREPVRVRRRRAGQPRRRHAVPDRRRERLRLVRLTAHGLASPPIRIPGATCKPGCPRPWA